MSKNERPGTTRFGWCLDGHHENCARYAGDKECSCTCHKEAA